MQYFELRSFTHRLFIMLCCKCPILGGSKNILFLFLALHANEEKINSPHHTLQKRAFKLMPQILWQTTKQDNQYCCYCKYCSSNLHIWTGVRPEEGATMAEITNASGNFWMVIWWICVTEFFQSFFSDGLGVMLHHAHLLIVVEMLMWDLRWDAYC